jgi:effector-binding domain-containing protein
LQLKRAELEAEIAEFHARLQRVESRVRLIEEEHIMPEYEVVVKQLESQRILSIRESLASAAEIEPLIDTVWQALKQQGIAYDGPLMSLYHHEGFRDSDLDVEIAVSVSDGFHGSVTLDEDRALTLRQLDRHAEAATVIEDGHNESWAGSYGAIGRWIEAHAYEIVYPIREVYLTGPESEEGWIVELQFPVRKKEVAHV